MEVAWGERGQVISPSPELTSYIGVGEKLCVALWVPESPAKLCIVVTDDVFRILVWVEGRGGGCLSLLFPLPSGGGACGGLGRRSGGGHLGEGWYRGCFAM